MSVVESDSSISKMTGFMLDVWGSIVGSGRCLSLPPHLEAVEHPASWVKLIPNPKVETMHEDLWPHTLYPSMASRSSAWAASSFTFIC
jgi:hypothetical protein